MRRLRTFVVTALVAVATLVAGPSHARVADSITLTENPRVIEKDYPGIAGSYPAPVSPYAVINRDACRDAAYCDVVDVTINASKSISAPFWGMRVTMTWNNPDINDLDLYLYNDERTDDTDRATNSGLTDDSTSTDPQEQVQALDTGNALMHIVILNVSGLNTGYHLKIEFVEGDIGSPDFLRKKPGASARPLAVERTKSGDLVFGSESGDQLAKPSPKAIKTPGADGPAGDQALSVLLRGQKGSRTETVLSPVALGLIVVMLAALAAGVLAYVRRRRAQ